MLLGQSTAMVLDYAKGKQAIRRIFTILDNNPVINTSTNVDKQQVSITLCHTYSVLVLLN
jgi:hypothetical protein